MQFDGYPALHRFIVCLLLKKNKSCTVENLQVTYKNASTTDDDGRDTYLFR